MKKIKLLQILALTIGLMMMTGNVWGQTNLIDENIQSWTARASYGTWTQAIPAGTVNMVACIVQPAASASGTGSIGRVQMQGASGILELPQLSSVGTVEFRIAAGGASRTLKLQKFNGSTWDDITTFTGIGTTGATYTYNVNLGTATRIRLSAPSSAVYVHDILVTDYATSTPLITVAPTTLTGFTYVEGSGPSAEQSFTISGENLTANISIAATTNYEISTGTGGSFVATDPITLTQSGGTVATTTIYVRLKANLAIGTYNSEDITATSADADNKTVTCSGSVTAPPSPTITVDPSVLSGFTYVEDSGPSDSQSFEVSGTALNGSNVTIAAPANFEVSEIEAGTYGASVTLTAYNGTATDIWVRLVEGLAIDSYAGNVSVTGGGATAVNVAVSGEVLDPPAPGYFVDFEGAGETKGAYGSGSVTLSGISWNMTEALIGTDAADWKNGARSARMRGYAASAMTMLADKPNGIGTVSFNYRRYGTDAQVDWKVEYSTNAGVNWTPIGSAFTAPASDVVQVFSEVVNVSGNIRVRIKRATETGSSNARLNIDDISITDYTSGGNLPPSITNIVQDPASGITSSTTVSVSADVTDNDGTVEGVALYWGTTSGNLTSNIEMTLSSGNTYTTVSDIPAQSNGTTVYYEIYAIDDDADDATSAEQSYTVTNPVTEPSNHPTNFAAVVNSSSAIIVAWDDAVPAADGYLIKGSATSYAAIDEPEDGTPEGDALLVQNIAAGDETHEFTGLAASTHYFFKIYPYNGSGASINYLITGAPEATAKTDDLPPAPKVFISEYLEGTSNNKAIEIYNGESTDIELSLLSVRLYGNGSSTQTETWTGSSGTLAPGETIIIYNSGATLPDLTTYGFATSSVTFYNGDDALAVYYNSQLTDVFGEIGNDPGTAWSVAGTANATAEYTLLRKPTVAEGNRLNLGSFGTTPENSEWIVMPQNYTGNIGEFGTAFTGTIDQDWATAGNWDAGVPVASRAAIIPPAANISLLSGDAEVTNLLIKATGQLNITGSLEVTGALTNSATATGLVIKSDETGTGSLVHSTADVPATVERYLAGSEQWRLLSSPVESQAISGVWTPTGSYTGGWGYDFYAWSEAGKIWLNQKDETNNLDAFVPGAGYLVSFEAADQTKSFVGELNNGNTIVAVTSTDIDDYAGSNLLGNPYPSAIDWNDAIRTLFADDFAYVYDRVAEEEGVTEGYLPIDGSAPNAFIAAHQGFFVIKETAGSSDFTFTNAMRAHGGTFTKDGSIDNKLVLNLNQGNYFDQTTIRIRENSVPERDRSDAIKMFSYNAQVPQLYSISDDAVNLAINTIPAVKESTVIPVSVKVPANGSMTITLDELTGEFENHTILLVDQKTSKIHKLSDSPSYTFDASTTDTDRFLLKFEMVGIGENPAIEQTAIYSYGQTIYLNTTESVDAVVSVFNITGQQVYSNRLMLDGLKQINLNLPTGWYVVQAVTSGSAVSRKVFIQ